MATLRPTFSESWYRVADLKAKLRPSAQISRQYYRGDRWYVVRDPAGNQFHRLSAPAYRFIGLLDGSRTVAEAWELVGGQLADDAPTQNEVIQILSQLHAANLLESNVTPDAQVLLRRHKKQTQRKWQGRLMNILFPRIPLWDLDSFLVRWMPVMRVFLSPFGAVLWLLVVGAAVFMIAPEWTRLQAAAANAIEPHNWPFLWATFVLIKLIHELGHGFYCRRYGGECHELGVMFLVLVPAPYVDASSAWAFPNKWHRILVGAGGMIFELFVAAIAAFVWLNTQPGYSWYGIPVNGLAYNIMLIASVSTVIFNANPLLRYDGYYMLSDWLEIPNLRYRSTEYSLGLIKRHLFRVKQHQPLPPVGQRFWLFFYAITSGIYRTLIGVAIILMVWDQVPVLGVLMAIGGVITWALVPVFKITKYLMLDPELHRKRMRATAYLLAFVGLLIAVIWGIPMPAPLYAEGIIQPATRHVVHTRTPGTVDKIVARDGQEMKKGDVILVCRDDDLAKEINQLEDRRIELEIQSEALFDKPAQRRMVEWQKGAVNKQLNEAYIRRDELTIRASEDGRLIAPNLHHMQGMYLPPGAEIATVAQVEKLRVIASVDQDDAALAALEIGRVAEVRPYSQVHNTKLRARLETYAGPDGEQRLLPTPHFSFPKEWAALTHLTGNKAPVDAAAAPTDAQQMIPLQRPQIVMSLVPDEAAAGAAKWDAFLPGQRCELRFETGKKPWGQQWSRRLWQLIQSHSSNTKWM